MVILKITSILREQKGDTKVICSITPSFTALVYYLNSCTFAFDDPVIPWLLI
jgi:hypothetical protein